VTFGGQFRLGFAPRISLGADVGVAFTRIRLDGDTTPAPNDGFSLVGHVYGGVLF
jgi:hypothetical protein